MGLFSFSGQLCCLFPMDWGNTLIITMSLDIFWWILAFEFSHTITVRHLFAWTNIKYTVKLQVNINALICSMVYNYMFEFNFLHATFLETNTSVKFDLFVWYMLNNVLRTKILTVPKCYGVENVLVLSLIKVILRLCYFIGAQLHWYEFFWLCFSRPWD